MNSSHTLKPADTAPTRRFVLRKSIAIAALLFFGATAARAASATWTGATDSNWATTTNWSASPVPGSGDSASFGNTNNGHTTISLGAGVTVLSLSFSVGSVAALNYTIGAGGPGAQTLTLNHGGIVGIGENSFAQDHLINAAVVLGTNSSTGSYRFWTDSNRTLTLAGNVAGGTGGTAGTKTLTVGLNGDSGNVVIDGVLGGGGGTIALLKTSTSTLTLNGNNTFTGALTIEGGTVSIPAINNSNADGPLGHSTGAVIFNVDNAYAPGVLKYTGGTASSSKLFTLTSGGTFNVDSAAADLTLAGVISGAGSSYLTKSGPGTLTLTAVNTYVAGTNINAGTLRLSGSGRLGATTGWVTINNGGKLDLGGTDQTVGGVSTSNGVGSIVNNGGGASLLTVNVATGYSPAFGGSILDNDNATAGTVSVTKSGAGYFVLGSIFCLSNYSGATLVTNGVLYAASANALGSATTGTTVSSGATLDIYLANISSEPITISGAGETGFNGALQGENAIYGGLLKLNAASTVATSFAGGTFDITNPGIITGASFLLTLAGEGTGSIASVIGTTSGGVTKTDTGKWTLSGANTYTGTTTISAGILNIQNANALGASTSSDTTITSGATLQIEGGITTPAGEGVTVRGTGAFGATGALENVAGTNTWAGDVTLGADSTISSDSGTLSLTNTASTITGSTFDLTLSGDGDGSIASVLATTSGTVTKSGGGTWSLTALNTYTGRTFIHGGVLEINTLKDVSGGSSSLGAPTTSVNGIIDVGTGATTGTLRFIGTADATSNRMINLSGTTGGATIDSSSPTNNRILFTGAVAATFLGDKTLTLTGTSTGNNEFSNAIGDSSGFKTSVAKTGSGKWILSAATNSYTGDTSVSAGTLAITNAYLANAADVNLTTGATLNLTFAGSDTIDQLRINGVVQSPGTWGSLASTATYKTALITGTGILNVGTGASQPPYESWAASFALSGADHPFDADPERDAIDNGLEWILGGSPLAGSASILPQVSSDATYLFLTFNRNDGSESSSTLTAQWGAGLASWTDAVVGAASSGPDANGVIVTITENGASPDTIVVSIPRTLGPQGQLFARLRATMP